MLSNIPSLSITYNQFQCIRGGYRSPDDRKFPFNDRKLPPDDQNLAVFALSKTPLWSSPLYLQLYVQKYT